MKVGLLPLYLKLYDDTCPFMRPRIEAFRDTVSQKLTELGLEVIGAPVCRVKEEFAAAVKDLENQNVSVMITLHLAYSPSLESIDALADTKLPILVLDTTESFAFDSSVSADEILYNHGIHGVQDMCNLLRRRGKTFHVLAGHFERSDVLERVAGRCRGFEIAAAFRGARVGIVGDPFEGMGDFQIPFEELRRDFGVEVVAYDFNAGRDCISSVTSDEIARERDDDKTLFDWDESVTDELYERTARVCLGLRKWADGQNLTGMSVNFLATEGSDPGLPVMPFTECCKAMMRGVGYAGEGDVLTAALCGAVLRVFPETTFTEMFCPDWKGGSVFLSHMGEFNYRICAGKPQLTEKDFPFTSAENPTVAYGTYKPGKTVLINLLPGGSGKYTLILAPGEVLAIQGENRMAQSVNGWFKPDKPLPQFLEEFSSAGGTHHSVLCYGDCLDAMVSFASEMGFECVIL